MEFVCTKPISRMGAGYGEASEIVAVDSLCLVHMGLNHGTRQMQLVFAWHGRDSSGLYHMVPVSTLPGGAANLTYRVDGERQIWEDCLIDAKGNPVRLPTKAELAKILITHGRLAHMINGAWVLKSVELQYEGVTVGSSDENGLFKMTAK